MLVSLFACKFFIYKMLYYNYNKLNIKFIQKFNTKNSIFLYFLNGKINSIPYGHENFPGAIDNSILYMDLSKTTIKINVV